MAEDITSVPPPRSGAGAPASPVAGVPVVDLRGDVPSRHRPTRGAPREPDRHLTAYRGRAAIPLHRHDRPARLIEVDAVREHLAPHAHTAPSSSTIAGPPAVRGNPTEPATATLSSPRETSDVDELVVRRVRLWSVFKVALALNLCLFAVVMVAGAILWRLANEQGWVTGWTGFLVDIGFTDAAVDGRALARASATTSGILVATGTLIAVATACLYNQIAGLFGGLVVTYGPRRRRRRRHRR